MLECCLLLSQLESVNRKRIDGISLHYSTFPDEITMICFEGMANHTNHRSRARTTNADLDLVKPSDGGLMVVVEMMVYMLMITVTENIHEKSEARTSICLLWLILLIQN